MAISADTSVPTANGWVLGKDLKNDDIVFDNTGAPCQIKTVQHYTPSECYEVEFDDGLVVTGDKHLAFYLQNRRWRNSLTKYMNYPTTKKRRKFRRPLIKKVVSEITELYIGNRLDYSVPNCLPVQYPTRDLPVPPYIFGIWFATLSPTNRHWLRDQPLNKMQRIFRTHGHFIKTRKHKNGDTLFDIRPSVRDSFLFAGLDIPTTIPFYYLDSNPEQRTELLSGLIDGGFIKKYSKSNFYYAKDANYHLMRKIQGLIESLGIKTTLNTPTNSPSYTLKFRANGDFSQLYGTNRRFVVKITKISPKPCVHIETDGQFLIGEGFIPVC